jgi:hypothetical protein
MERSGFPLSSMSALGASLWVLSLLTGAFSVSLPLLKVNMLGWVATNGAPLYQTVFGGSYLGLQTQAFLGWGQSGLAYFCRVL